MGQQTSASAEHAEGNQISAIALQLELIHGGPATSRCSG